MRDIVFKAKKLNGSEWAIGSYVHTFNEDKKCPVVGVMTENHWIVEINGNIVLIDKETLCQYTGLSACWIAFENEPQEQDVWEHDLLEVVYEGKKVIAEVQYENGMCILASNAFVDSYIPLFDVVEIEDGCAYVNAEHKGNIFDNPELLNN